jgi:hypothetical protein
MSFTPQEYEQLGRHWLHAVGTAAAMGHTSAAGLADYVNPEDLPPLGRLVLDSFSATRADAAGKEARAHMAAFVAESDTLDLIGEAVTR